MSKPTVYLAGPIANTKPGEAFNWRERATIFFDTWGVAVLSPMRGKAQLSRDCIGDDHRAYSDYGWAYTPAGILTRDHGDVTNCDVVLMNLIGARSMSFGTGMELAWAYDRHIRTVVAIEDNGNIHDKHPMFFAAAKIRVPDLEDACSSVLTILGL